MTHPGDCIKNFDFSVFIEFNETDDSVNYKVLDEKGYTIRNGLWYKTREEAIRHALQDVDNEVDERSDEESLFDE